MTSRERVLKAISFKKIDYIPVFTNHRGMGPRLIGRAFNRDLFLDGDALAKAELAAWEEIQPDAFCIGGSTAMQTALGCILQWPGDDHPQFGEATIKTREDLEKLEIPAPGDHPYMAALLEEIRLLRKWVGESTIYSIAWHGIFNNASRMLGIEKLMAIMSKDHEFLEALCTKIVDAQLVYAKAMKEAGADIMEIGDAMCGPSIISPKMFRELAVPHIRRQMQGFKDLGLIAQFHACGGEYPIIDQMQDTEADILWFSELVDIDVAQKIFYRRFAVAGGVDPANTLYLGTPDSIDQEIKELISKLKHRSGIIIQPGCGLGTNIPMENLKAMAQAVRKYSDLAGQRKI
ncbi:MAG TPA: uroporphyrinogen decarboxylase family protein [Desulfitobacteriaceae bacterium]|nr:uroporphyrinogen decarboxylase family protein [Desulfitobacteriaceae bacterium]